MLSTALFLATVHLRNLIVAHPVSSSIVIDLRKVLVQKRTAFGIKSTKDQVESKTRV
jgi:hypothetical protein